MLDDNTNNQHVLLLGKVAQGLETVMELLNEVRSEQKKQVNEQQELSGWVRGLRSDVGDLLRTVRDGGAEPPLVYSVKNLAESQLPSVKSSIDAVKKDIAKLEDKQKLSMKANIISIAGLVAVFTGSVDAMKFGMAEVYKFLISLL